MDYIDLIGRAIQPDPKTERKMITEHMTLTTKNDAKIWAGQMGLDTEDSAKLAEWIWANKPEIGCTYEDHPLSKMDSEAMYAAIA